MEKSSPRKAQPRPEAAPDPSLPGTATIIQTDCKPIFDNNNTVLETEIGSTASSIASDKKMLPPNPVNFTLLGEEVGPAEDAVKQSDSEAEGAGCSSGKKDSLKKDCEFVVGLDVLARWNDGLLYLGIVSKVIPHQKKCLVIFEDKSEHWVLFKHLQKGRTPNSEITCCVCEGDQSEPPNEIVICDRCGLGYHQLCHQPAIDSHKLLCPDESWHCRQCVFVNSAKVGGALKKGPGAKVFQEMKQSLPYKLDSLHWDSAHKTNTEQCYCYCGGPGEWYLKMLRCCRCMQWFHEACVQCLEMPMLYGDGFYIFVCSVCNAGPEYLKRLPLKWQDLAQLVLYNLTLMHRKKYYDFEEEIIPYLTEQWYNLQVSHLGATTRSEKQERFLDALHSSKARFACGKEVKKKQNIWGLRIRKPPIPPTIILPAIGQITDEVMNDLKMTGRKVMTFIPVESNSPVPLKPAKRKRKSVAETPEELERRSINARKMFEQAIKDGVPRPAFSLNQSYTGYSGGGMALANLTPVSEGQSVLDTIRPFETVYSGSTGVPLPVSFSQHSSVASGDTGSDYSATTVLAGQSSASADGESGDSNNNDNNEEGSGVDSLKRHRKHGSWKRKRKHLHPSTPSKERTPTSPNPQPAAKTISHPPSRGESPEKLATTRLNGAVTMAELKRSMSNHYGAEGRLACGEKHQLLGRRVTPDGKIQYLIQWEGISP
ncbi:metal-response element-binding transcription factor 2-like [Acanthaster planci]|uniref:Metal-response element-binding transcription factor 2-like n=1 Tax=Acanthaster planci TaxID=133434 RepID=A0A8B7ZWM6_ACAPL|nr:metal-response element-binding transcription factor 2-like [Acanthaster planci]XP_022107937.1 metal-response element-binding transcription factor 2-like [Acanthaster planci]